jgi:hypothetical protein
VQAPFTGDEIVTDVAVTAPVVSAGPIAVTQSPVANWDEVAEVVVVTVAEPLTVTLTDFVTNCGFFEREALDPVVFGILAFTVRVVPLTTVTGPEAVAKLARRPLVGNVGLVPVPPPKPPRNPPAPPAPPAPGAPAPNPPPPTPAKPSEHVDEVPWLSEMVVAFIPLAVLPEPVALTQSPTAMEEVLTCSSKVNVVVETTVTVVWPVVP